MSEPTRSGLLEREKSFWNARDHGAYELMRGTIVRAVGEFDRNRDRRELYDAQDKVVLDWGCGRGLEIPGLIERDGARHVTGIDLSEEELALARELAESRGVADKTSFVVKPSRELPVQRELPRLWRALRRTCALPRFDSRLAPHEASC